MKRDRRTLIALAIIVVLAGLVLFVGVVVSARFDRGDDAVGDCASCRLPAHRA